MKSESTRKRQPRKKTSAKKVLEDVVIEEPMPQERDETPAEEPSQEPSEEIAQELAQEPQQADEQATETNSDTEDDKTASPSVVTPTDGSSHEYEIFNNVSKEDTRELMKYLGVGMLPEEKNDMYWVRAVAKVLKRDSSVSWCVLKRTSVDKHKVEKVFGSCSPIVKIGRPFTVQYIPRWGLEKAKRLDREGKIEWMRTAAIKHGGEVEWEKLSDEELDVELLKTEIRRHGIYNQ